ncbi:hypothetical protein [Fodinicola acaciae]|uniref:hypothetical protein n=1 Tax=Fodinicola acaciae TaxID=2681555 RepID=UPI0013D201C0|nr:hypothetical protein [Fodinicola acaciae]
MAGQFIGVNPNQAVGAGQTVEALGSGGASMRSDFQLASYDAAAAAVERNLPAAYEGYQALWTDRINQVIHLTEQSGMNVQAGGAAAAETDTTAASGFDQAHATIPPINRGVTSGSISGPVA